MIEKSELRNFLEEREKINSDEFISRLDSRKLEEVEHSDIIHAPTELTGIDQKVVDQHALTRPVYSTNRAVRSFIDKWIKHNSKDKVVLDLACGSGEMTLAAAQAGASIAIGTELAPITIQSNNNLKAEADNNLFFILDDVENMQMPSNSVDIIICSGMLHHVDLATAFPEINRVLKKGGKILAIEALKYNPVFNLYRKLTPGARTHWEAAHILGLKEVNFANKYVPVEKIRYWQLFTILSIFFPKTIRPYILKFMEMLDSIVLNIPYLNRMAWIFTIEFKK